MRSKRQAKSDQRTEVVTERSQNRRENKTQIEGCQKFARDSLANRHSKRDARFVSHKPAQFLAVRDYPDLPSFPQS